MKASYFDLISNLRVDLSILVAVLVLALGGFLLTMSASTAYAEYYFNAPFYFSIRHFIFLILGLVAMFGALFIPLSFWQRWYALLLAFSVFLLLLVFTDALGKEVNASARWIDLRFVSFQPVEVLKFTLPLFLAAYLSRHAQHLQRGWAGLIAPLTIIGVVGCLLLLQPDFGGLVVLTSVAMAILFLGGMRWRELTVLVLAGMGLFLFLTAAKPYRLERLKCLTDENVWRFFFDACYQIGHSLIAIERGGLLGLGLGASVQKYFYLPEAYTDFIFAIMAEELGFLVCLILFALFGFLCVRILVLGLHQLEQGRLFVGYLLAGIAVLWMTQTLVNLGVSLGYFPITGLPLPFFSYGGSGLLINMFLAGVVLRSLAESSKPLAAAELASAR